MFGLRGPYLSDETSSENSIEHWAGDFWSRFQNGHFRQKNFSDFFSSGLQAGLPEIAIFRVGPGGDPGEKKMIFLVG